MKEWFNVLEQLLIEHGIIKFIPADAKREGKYVVAYNGWEYEHTSFMVPVLGCNKVDAIKFVASHLGNDLESLIATLENFLKNVNIEQPLIQRIIVLGILNKICTLANGEKVTIHGCKFDEVGYLPENSHLYLSWGGINKIEGTIGRTLEVCFDVHSINICTNEENSTLIIRGDVWGEDNIICAPGLSVRIKGDAGYRGSFLKKGRFGTLRIEGKVNSSDPFGGLESGTVIVANYNPQIKEWVKDNWYKNPCHRGTGTIKVEYDGVVVLDGKPQPVVYGVKINNE